MSNTVAAGTKDGDGVVIDRSSGKLGRCPTAVMDDWVSALVKSFPSIKLRAWVLQALDIEEIMAIFDECQKTFAADLFITAFEHVLVFAIAKKRGWDKDWQEIDSSVEEASDSHEEQSLAFFYEGSCLSESQRFPSFNHRVDQKLA